MSIPFPHRHILGVDALSREDITRVLDTADAFFEVSRRPVRKVPTLRGKTVINLFYENSTRTRTSFELAGKRMSADVINISVASSSVAKGETLYDTVKTLEAMHPDVVIMRHSASGAPHFVARHLGRGSVINAGDGMHAHPTQALLDAFTLRRALGSLEGAKVAIVGDIVHSRVARSNALLLSKFGAEVRFVGPDTLVPPELGAFGAKVVHEIEEGLRDVDVIMVLRIQRERLKGALLPTLREYSRTFGINRTRLALAKPDALVMHPGPMNRGVEIEPEGRRRAALEGAGSGRSRCRRPDGAPLSPRSRAGTRRAGRGPMTRARTGLDRLAAGEPALLKRLRGRRVGLVAHPASVDAQLRHALPLLRASGADVVALFGPEHGYGGEAQDMAPVDSEGGPAAESAALVVHSLYGETYEDLTPREDALAGLDVIVVDLQDVGSRYYTFVWTMALVFRAAARLGIETIVLDRPNPLGGVVLEGRPQRGGYRSFVGLYDVPNRHGMTIGEIARMVRELESISEDALFVAELEGWNPRHYFDETGLPWVLPSPNMPTLETALVYPGGCLLEGLLLSEGRGSTRPFEIFGAPWLDGEALARAVGEIEGATLRPLSFSPTFQKLAGERCQGLQVHVRSRAAFRSYAAYQRILSHAIRLAPDAPRWRTEEYEYVTDRPAIDLLTGGPELRELVDDAGAELDAGLKALSEADEAGALDFADRRRAWCLYPRPA